MKEKIKQLSFYWKDSSRNVRLSMLFMGSGQFLYGARAKGILLFLIEVSMVFYFVSRGFSDLVGFFTLGTVRGDAWLGIEGDNSVVMLLMGIFAWIALAVFFCVYQLNVKDAYHMQKRVEQGKPIRTFREEAAELFDRKFYVTVLVLPVLAYAIPGFITLLAFKFMFSYGGPINQMIVANGKTAIGFLDIDAKWTARLIGLLVNCWISTPSIMLLATGHLSNRDITLYEAARIDGAGKWKQFKTLTMPFILFATMPVLISQFVGNFNNFGIFYFLRGGLYMDGYFLASDTDLLINWLYNLSIDNNYYCIGAAISLVIFVITSVISLMVYIKSPSYREEDTFQ